MDQPRGDARQEAVGAESGLTSLLATALQGKKPGGSSSQELGHASREAPVRLPLWVASVLLCAQQPLGREDTNGLRVHTGLGHGLPAPSHFTDGNTEVHTVRATCRVTKPVSPGPLVRDGPPVQSGCLFQPNTFPSV